MKLVLSDKTELEVINNSDDPAGEFFSEDLVDAIQDLDKALSPIVKFAEDALASLKEGVKPSELEISFGAEAGGEGGFFGLAKAHAKATISVKMTWRP